MVEYTSRWNRVNQRGGSLVLIILLVWVSVATHAMALLKMDFSLALADDRTIGEVRLIGFVRDQPWIALLYFGFLIGIWFWLGLRVASWWRMVFSLAVLSLPCVLYIRACYHIGFKLLLYYQGP
jgi:hypothetical protein